MKTLITVDRVR